MGTRQIRVTVNYANGSECEFSREQQSDTPLPEQLSDFLWYIQNDHPTWTSAVFTVVR